MLQELVDENPRGDLLQGLDDIVGPTIEKAVQKFLPRDIARKIRREAIEFLGEKIRPSENQELKDCISRIVNRLTNEGLISGG